MKEITLPKPVVKGGFSVEEAISSRRSVRSFQDTDVTLEQLSQLLWSAQGVTDTQSGFRASPSAGALYPLEISVAKSDGVFRYVPKAHALECASSKDIRNDLVQACRGQRFVGEAPVDIIICAVYERVTERYGQRGIRYADIEVGHAAENIALEAVSLGLSTVMVGAFDDAAVSKILGLADDTQPVYIIPVGYKK